MLIQVPANDLMSLRYAECNLYSISGGLVLAEGERIEESHKTLFNQQLLYRRSLELPGLTTFSHEGQQFHFVSRVTESERVAEQKAQKAPALLDDALSEHFVLSIGDFLKRLQKGASPDIALCEVARDKLIATVTAKADEIQFLSQIRMRDGFTYSHILDVTALSIALAMKIGFDKQAVKEVALAAILHDLGKLLIPEAIMFKPSRLSEREFQVMKLHPELGYKMIRNDLKLPEVIALPALEHQEMYGGGGYPQNIQGDAIHPYSHVVKIADVYDALTSKRPYKESIPSAKAIKIMLSEGDKSFHPEYLAKFVELSNYHDFSQECFLKPLDKAS